VATPERRVRLRRHRADASRTTGPAPLTLVALVTRLALVALMALMAAGLPSALDDRFDDEGATRC